MRSIKGTRTLKVEGASLKPASAPKLTATAVPAPVKPLSKAVVVESAPEVSAATTSANARNRLVGAVKFGHGLWRLQAKFQDLRIQGVSAIGTPGCLDGPELAGLIDLAPDIQTLTGIEAEFYEAVRDGVSACFEAWRGGVMVPGLPWYPGFAAWPGPQAPPTPNLPTPLIACASTSLSRITQPELKEAMLANLSDELKTPEALGMFEQIAADLGQYFLAWLPSQMVMNVLGKGPVPTFAPPYVPVGPVVGGDNIATPGHLAV
jgi:hypothetical protein